jgi:DNA-binding NtrC family response regulator
LGFLEQLRQRLRQKSGRSKPHGFEEISYDAPPDRYVLLVMYPFYYHFFGARLTRAGYAVRWTNTVEDAMLRMKQARPGLVVCQIGNSDPYGLQLLTEMKDVPELAAVPVLAIAEKEKGGLASQAKALGAIECYTLPISPDVVVEFARKTLPPT